MKRYSTESGSGTVRGLTDVVVSILLAVEVPSAIWRKHRTGTLTQANARILIRQFEAEYSGTAAKPSEFEIIALTSVIVSQAASLVSAHPLRAYDAVQLASAMAARVVDASLNEFCAYDQQLTTAARAQGFVIVR